MKKKYIYTVWKILEKWIEKFESRLEEVWDKSLTEFKRNFEENLTKILEKVEWPLK